MVALPWLSDLRLKLTTALLLAAWILWLVNPAYSWNALGHRLVAQIAYHHLSAKAKEASNYYNGALNKFYPPQNFVNAATWLDNLRASQPCLDGIHYIAWPFSFDGTELIPENKLNAILAIEEAKAMIQDTRRSAFIKGIHLRILLHVVGDIHQPLHAVNCFSKRFPKGDKGGNLFCLKANPVAGNLHSYWDKGGGWLWRTRHFSHEQLNKIAYRLEKRWPCQLVKMDLNTKNWAKESQTIAIKDAYQLKFAQKPSKRYQRHTRLLTEQRIALAGCRLAALLNKLTQ